MPPKIVSRAEWGAAPATRPGRPWRVGQPTGWTVHWAGVAVPTQPHEKCDDGVRADQRYHLGNGYSDVAYSFLVCQHGTVYEGRGYEVQSAANYGGNSLRLAVQFHGGPGTPFSAATRRAIRSLVYETGPASARGHAIPHRLEPSCATTCPGDEITAWVRNGMPTEPAPAPSPNRPTLRPGDRGPDVRKLQQRLNSVLGGNLVADGVFGPFTKRAVRLFQQREKDRGALLVVDGIVGPKTWAALDAYRSGPVR